MEHKHIKREVLLPRLPEHIRSSVRHFELVACINSFTPRPPLQGRAGGIPAKTFAYAVVTDFCLYLVSLERGEGGLLELPLLQVADMV